MRLPLRTAITLLAAAALAAADFATALTRADLDPAAATVWVDGVQAPLDPAVLRNGPADILCTGEAPPASLGIGFGDGRSPGPRHLRIGLLKAVAIGTVIARGDALSVLKPDAAYPGDPNDERQWIPAQRLTRDGIVATAEKEDWAVWTLPPGTVTRALRFTHVAAATDPSFAGWLGGFWPLRQRYVNLGVAAVASANANADHATRAIDQRNDGWKAWDNADSGAQQVVSAGHPAWVTLAWNRPRSIAGLVGMNVGASLVEAQVCTAPPDRHPADAAESDWRTVLPAATANPFYPHAMSPVALAFPAAASTRGVRLRLVAPLDPGKVHNHLKNKIDAGRRVWLDEILALEELGDRPLVAEAPAVAPPEHPPIAVPFHLERAGLVTLVIEDAAGNRVRNLVAETPFPAGDNTAWWDGLDDRGRDEDAANHGQYRIPGALVAPGSYRVRGLVRDDIGLTWEFAYFNPGNPPWGTADGTGDWLADHSAPNAACFVPAGMTADGQACVMLGSAVAEAGSGLVWVDLDGHRRAGVRWLGGIWTGAPYLACDRGAHPAPDFYGYSASAFQGELRLGGLKRAGGDASVLKWNFPDKTTSEIAGVAARDGLVAVSMPKLGAILLVAAAGGKVIGQLPCPQPAGIAFDDTGALVAISAGKIVRIALPADLGGGTGAPDLAAIAHGATTLVADGLDAPVGICVDGGRMWVSLHGAANQVLVFAADGRLQGRIGHPGPRAVGTYDPLHMNSPAGLTIDTRGRLWVAENSHQPKRISVWNPDGTLAAAYYGPPPYGGGGTIDPADPTRLFLMGMELSLDWNKGTSAVKNLFWPRNQDRDLAGDWGPEDPVHVGGRTYLTTSYNGAPTNAPGLVGAWRYADGTATLVAAAGRAADWDRMMDGLGLAGRYSARWSGRIVPPVTGTIEFQTACTDGVRLWVDGKPLVDRWKDNLRASDRGSIALTAGKPVPIRMEWYHDDRSARTRVLWSGPGLRKAAVTAEVLIPDGTDTAGGLSVNWFRGTDLGEPLFTRIEAGLDVDLAGGLLTLPGAEHEALRARLPEGALNNIRNLLFTWSDRDGDGRIAAAETAFRAGSFGGMTIQPDLSLATSTGLLMHPAMVGDGVPVWDPATAEAVVAGGRAPTTSGGGHTLACPDGWTVLTVPPEPAPPQSSLSGVRDGVLKWTYPNPWPGLHPSHHAPAPDRPGMVIGTTRAVGPPFKPAGGDAGWCWAINSDKGVVYVFTSDGLFVATLFKDSRLASRWLMPVATRGMHVEDTSLGQENFWPTISETPDGRIHLLSDGSIVTVSGLESIRRLPARPLAVSAAQLAAAQGWTVEQERRRQAALGTRTLRVALRATAPTVDGVVDDWSGADWATIERRKATDGSDQLVTAAVAVAGDRLYAAWRTGDARLLNNAGTTWQNLFKTGGCLDLMIGADPAAAADRREPAAGDHRLLVTLVGGKPEAVLYTPVVPGHTGERQPFVSPVSTVQMDEVVRVEDRITVAGKDGDYELSVPLSLLGLKPAAGQVIAADIGLLRGNGFATMRRVYWSNKGTQITEDLPSEARLEPALWGRWVFAAGH